MNLKTGKWVGLAGLAWMVGLAGAGAQGGPAQSSWTNLSKGVTDGVHALAFVGTNLYIGGAFSWTEDNLNFELNQVARWTGTTWTNLGDGLDRRAEAMASHGSDLYVAGGFLKAGGATIYNVAKWDGTS
jgi:trimeric autotransporter adhesin